MQDTINSHSDGFENEETVPMMESKFKYQAGKIISLFLYLNLIGY